MSHSSCTPLMRQRRRECLQVGGLSLLGLSAAQLQFLRNQAAAAPQSIAPRANSCVFIFLFGGPSHIDLWDMKSHAPAEIRGEFQPVSTSVPGIQICEHLPRLAAQMDKLCLLRSMNHDMRVHGPACSEIYSGRPYFGPPVTDQALPEDWPSLASLVARYKPSGNGLPPSVVLPWYSQFVGQDRRIAGQTGGRMGEQWNSFLISGDPTEQEFEVQGITLPEGIGTERFQRRQQLREGLQSISDRVMEHERARRYENRYATARELVSAAQSTTAFSLKHEPDANRDRYGRTTFGQSLLMARQLVEAGISLVTVNWDDVSRNNKVSPHWDTHHDNFPRLRSQLCPLFDQAFAAFLADMDERGLLDTTLVVALGEFGRTPQIGLKTQNGMTEPTGRDHWPHAFTTLIAGGGVRGGQVYGATTATGAYVANKPVTPADLCATVFQHLGVDASQSYFDEFQRIERRLSIGKPVDDLG